MPEKIILAEDNQAMRDALVEVLKDRGFEVVADSDRAAAEAAAREGPFHLLILDLLMPKKQGMQVAEALRAANINAPIMMMTGVLKGPAQVKEAKDRFGVKEYLIKPFEGDQFLAAVES